MFYCLFHHQAKTCKSKVKCSKCSERHISLMHDDEYFNNKSAQSGSEYKWAPSPENNKKVSTWRECYVLIKENVLVYIVLVQIHAMQNIKTV